MVMYGVLISSRRLASRVYYNDIYAVDLSAATLYGGARAAVYESLI